MEDPEAGHRFDTDRARCRFFSQAREAVRRAPGVKTAAFTSQLPLSGDLDGYGIEFEDDNSPNGDYAGFSYAVIPDYFETMGIPLRRGRLLDEHDMAGPPVAARMITTPGAPHATARAT